jgi:hypothetical protein
MERCILACNDAGIRVPKPFYDAKHRETGKTRLREDGTREGELPRLKLPEDSDEISRMAKAGRAPAVQM